MKVRRNDFIGAKIGDDERKSEKNVIKPGSVMNVATKNVITIPPTSTIMSAVKTMITYSFRRLPVADPGTKRLEGIITGMDIVNFFGGGEKHGIVKERYDGNFLVAINEEVREIMERDVIAAEFTSSFEDVLELLLKNRVGGMPIVDREDRVIGILTERDVLHYLSSHKDFDGVVSDYMTKGVITAEPDTTIREAMRIMVEKGIRRLPIIKDGILMGLLTSTTLLQYFASGEAFKLLITGDVSEIIDKPVKVILSNEKVLQYREPLTFPPYASISEVVEKMVETGHGAALIVGDEDLVGIVTERDLVKFLCQVKC
jgi:CBS domain-containing protein